MAAQVAFDYEPPPPTKVEPTTSGRIHTYDLIRGFAVLGILLANIPFFAGPEMGRMFEFQGPESGLDATVSGWTAALVTGRFRSMLAILFGVGIWLQYRKRSQVAGNWPGGYLKRMLLLALFGLAHGIFIWTGDILFIYACTGLVICLLAPMSDRVLAWIVAGSGLLAILAGVGITLAGLLLAHSDFGIKVQDMSMGLSEKEELAVFASGSYLDQLLYRLVAFPMVAISMIFFLPFLGGLFVLGILLARHGVLEAPHEHKRARNWMLFIGFGFGLPLGFGFIPLMATENAHLFQNAVEFMVGPLVAVGLIMLLSIWGSSRFLGPVQRALARVGRTAFSCYILQSLVSTAIFYSWGGDLFGKLDRLQILAVVPIVWAIDLLFAHFWLNKFSMGPLEWLWRSWTEGRKLELQAASIPPLTGRAEGE